MKSPIVLFVYNRPEHTKKMLKALTENEHASHSSVFIFSDAPKDEKDIHAVGSVRKIIRNINGFKNLEIIERPCNYGLATSIIGGVSDIISQYKKVIVLEDDLITSPKFLQFMNYTLDKYEHNNKLFSITGYSHPINTLSSYSYDVYYFYRCMSWGWGTWADRWEKVDWEVSDYQEFKNNKTKIKEFAKGGIDLPKMLDMQMQGLVDSWAIRWCYAHYVNSAFCLYPAKTLVKNIGFDGSGTHCRKTKSQGNIEVDKEEYDYSFPDEISIDPLIESEILKIYRRSFMQKVMTYMKYKIKRILK